jgi:hypothetical protein
MKPKPDQDVSRRNAVRPLFSGELPISVLPTPPKEKEFAFSDTDRDAVKEVLKRESAAADDESS